MEYFVTLNDRECQMQPYTFDIADKIEETNKFNSSKASIKQKCRKMYNFACEVIGEDLTKEVLGEFFSADPNDINLCYFRIVDAYAKPVDDYQSAEMSSKLGDLSQLTDVLNAIGNVDKVTKR